MGRKVRFNGYELSKPVYDACKSILRTYPYLKNAQKSLEDIDGIKRNFAEKVISKIDLNIKVQEMEDAFGQIPKRYIDAVKYCLFARDTKEEKRYTVEAYYENDYLETVVWMEKLIYLYAKIAGYPVSERGLEFNLVIDEDGTIEIQ